jgi:uncharacterized protein YceK
MRTLLSCLAIILLTGCASIIIRERQEVSAAHIGCSPEQIQIINRGSYSWTAICKGRTFY